MVESASMLFSCRFFPEKKRDVKNDGKSDHRWITKHGAFMERIVQNFPALKS